MDGYRHENKYYISTAGYQMLRHIVIRKSFHRLVQQCYIFRTQTLALVLIDLC